MKQPLSKLLEKAAATLPPQKPGRSDYRTYLPLFLKMQEQGHNAVSMTDFLISEKEVEPIKRNSAYRSIRNLLNRHASE